MQWHFYVGYTVGGLLVIRIILGLFGPESARFSRLWFSLGDLVNYVKSLPGREASGSNGHNPMGALSIIAILIIVSLQVITGLFSEDDALFYSGPLAGEVSGKISLELTSYHHIFSNAILVLVGLHLSAIVYYLIWKKENLIKPMLTGNKWVKKSADKARDETAE